MIELGRAYRNKKSKVVYVPYAIREINNYQFVKFKQTSMRDSLANYDRETYLDTFLKIAGIGHTLQPATVTSMDCPVCGNELTGRAKTCSDKCRKALSRKLSTKTTF